MNNPFKSIPKSNVLHESDDFVIIRDTFPVSPGHLLIISKREAADFFSLTNSEKNQLNQCIVKAKSIIEIDYLPDGYNIGMNCGSAAGQTIFHFHCHLIPRYVGDMKNPRGGVRHCVEGKGNY